MPCRATYILSEYHMDLDDARQIIGSLADGVDPRTGESLNPGSPQDSPDVVCALHVALAAIDYQLARAQEPPRPAGLQ